MAGFRIKQRVQELQNEVEEYRRQAQSQLPHEPSPNVQNEPVVVVWKPDGPNNAANKRSTGGRGSSHVDSQQITTWASGRQRNKSTRTDSRTTVAKVSAKDGTVRVDNDSSRGMGDGDASHHPGKTSIGYDRDSRMTTNGAVETENTYMTRDKDHMASESELNIDQNCSPRITSRSSRNTGNQSQVDSSSSLHESFQQNPLHFTFDMHIRDGSQFYPGHDFDDEPSNGQSHGMSSSSHPSTSTSPRHSGRSIAEMQPQQQTMSPSLHLADPHAVVTSQAQTLTAFSGLMSPLTSSLYGISTDWTWPTDELVQGCTDNQASTQAQLYSRQSAASSISEMNMGNTFPPQSKHVQSQAQAQMQAQAHSRLTAGHAMLTPEPLVNDTIMRDASCPPEFHHSPGYDSVNTLPHDYDHSVRPRPMDVLASTATSSTAFNTAINWELDKHRDRCVGSSSDGPKSMKSGSHRGNNKWEAAPSLRDCETDDGSEAEDDEEDNEDSDEEEDDDDDDGESANCSAATSIAEQSLENRLEYIWQAICAAGFDNLDDAVSSYYTGDFSHESVISREQRASRHSRLPDMLKALRQNVGAWTHWEAHGYQSQVIKSAEGIMCEERLGFKLSRQDCDDVVAVVMRHVRLQQQQNQQQKVSGAELASAFQALSKRLQDKVSQTVFLLNKLK